LAGDAITKVLFTPVPKNVFSLIFSTWTPDGAIRTVVDSMKITPPDLRSKNSNQAVLFIPSVNGGSWNGAYQIPRPLISDDPIITYTATGLPPGLVLDPATGKISGALTISGSWIVKTGALFKITIAPAPAVLAPGNTHRTSGTVGASFTYIPSPPCPVGNTPSYSATGLPLGLEFDAATGRVSGTPTETGTGTVKISSILTITITDKGSTIAPAPTNGAASSPIATISGTTGADFEYTIPRTNNPTTGYFATGLPPGLDLDTSSGVVRGKPKAKGTWNVTIGTVTNIVIAPAAATPASVCTDKTSGTVGVSFIYIPKPPVGNPPSYTAAALPAGLVLDATTGEISGTPTAAGTGTVRIDSIYKITAEPAISAATPAPTKPATSSPITTIYGTTNISFQYPIPHWEHLSPGYYATGIPSGLNLDNTSGIISGTPTEAGSWTVAVGNSNAIINTLNITITDPDTPPPISFTEEPSDANCPLGGSAEFTATTNLQSVTYQWEVSSDSGKTWDEVSNGPDKETSDDPHHFAIYSGATTQQLSIAGATQKMNLNRYRCTVTEKESLPIVLYNNPKHPTYALFLAMTYEILKAQQKHLIPSPFPSDLEKKAQKKAEGAAEAKAITLHDIKLADVIAAQNDANNYTVEDSVRPADHAYKAYKNPPAPDNTSVLSLPNSDALKEQPLLHWIQQRGEHIELSLRSFDTLLYFVAKEDQCIGEFTKIFDNIQIPEKSPAEIKYHYNARLRFPTVEEPPFLHVTLTKIIEKGSAEGVKKELPSNIPDDILPPNYCLDVSISPDPTHGALVELALNDGAKVVEQFRARATLRLSGYKPTYHLPGLSHPLFGKTADYVVGDFDKDDLKSDIIPSMANQTEFTLLSYLFSQASIDSSKLPIQQLIEVR